MSKWTLQVTRFHMEPGIGKVVQPHNERQFKTRALAEVFVEDKKVTESAGYMGHVIFMHGGKSLDELAQLLDQKHGEAAESLPDCDMDGSPFNYNPERVEKTFESIALDNGFTLDQVKQQMDKNWHEQTLDSMADDGPTAPTVESANNVSNPNHEREEDLT